MSAEGKMLVAFVKDEKQATEFLHLLGEPQAFIVTYCKDHNIEYEERSAS